MLDEARFQELRAGSEAAEKETLGRLTSLGTPTSAKRVITPSTLISEIGALVRVSGNRSPPGPSGPVLNFIATAGTLTQLEMFQNPLNVLGRTLGRTPFGIFARFQVLDFDLFFGFLFLVLHVCHFSFAGLFTVCVFVGRARMNSFRISLGDSVLIWKLKSGDSSEGAQLKMDGRCPTCSPVTPPVLPLLNPWLSRMILKGFHLRMSNIKFMRRSAPNLT